MRLGPVLADDFTGACDVGAELLGIGPVRVTSVVDGRYPPVGDDVAVGVANTQSRAISSAEAARRVRDALGARTLGEDEVGFKKIDTALRGHVAPELLAAIECLRPGLVLVAPAIPEVGRTTEGGVQRIHGVAVSETAFRQDPVNPVVDADLVSVLRSLESIGRVIGASLEVVRDADALAALVEGARGGGIPVIVADAAEDADLDAALAGMGRSGEPLLAVGSIGLARALRSRLTIGAAAVTATGAAQTRGEGVVVVCGSLHPAARAQLVDVERCWGVPPCEVGADPDGDGRMVARMVSASGLGVLASPLGARDVEAVAAGLREAIRGLFDAHVPGALVLIGGETAYHVLRALGGPVVEIDRRAEALIVDAHVATGRWAGLRLSSKGGSAGESDAVSRMVERAMKMEDEG